MKRVRIFWMSCFILLNVRWFALLFSLFSGFHFFLLAVKKQKDDKKEEPPTTPERLLTVRENGTGRTLSASLRLDGFPFSPVFPTGSLYAFPPKVGEPFGTGMLYVFFFRSFFPSGFPFFVLSCFHFFLRSLFPSAFSAFSAFWAFLTFSAFLAPHFFHLSRVQK